MINNYCSLSSMSHQFNINNFLDQENFNDSKNSDLFKQTLEETPPILNSSSMISTTSVFKKRKLNHVFLLSPRKKMKTWNSENISKRDKTISIDKTIVIEIFSSFLDNMLDEAHIAHEIIGNSEAGWNLAKKFHPGTRYIWSLNERITNQLIQGKFTPSLAL